MIIQALIIVAGANECCLAGALSAVALSEQSRLGKECPFTILATVYEFELHYRATHDPRSLASRIAKTSRTWAQRVPELNEKYYNTFSQSTLQRCDLTPAASHTIVFEGIDFENDGAKPNHSPKKLFEGIFLQVMTRNLPSIAIQSHHIGNGVAYLADMAARNIPVLILDATERSLTIRKHQYNGSLLTKLALKSQAFPTISKEQLQKILCFDDALTLDGRHELLSIALDMEEKKWQTLLEQGVVDTLSASTFAFFHSILQLSGARLGSTESNVIPLHLRISDLERSRKVNKTQQSVQIPLELVSRVLHFMQTRTHVLHATAEVSKVERWLKKHSTATEHLVPSATTYLAMMKEVVAAADEDGGDTNADIMGEEWLSKFDLLANKNNNVVFSGSLFDFEELKRIMGSIAKIDRLPQANSIEALKIIRDSWDHVEIYHTAANSYKIIAKISYVALLLIGIFITVIALIDCLLGNIPWSRVAIIVASFIGTAFVSYVNFTNPAMKVI